MSTRNRIAHRGSGLVVVVPWFGIWCSARTRISDGQGFPPPGWVARIKISENRTQIPSTQPVNPAGVVWRKCRVRWSVWGPGSEFRAFSTFWWFSGAGGGSASAPKSSDISRLRDITITDFFYNFLTVMLPGFPCSDRDSVIVSARTTSYTTLASLLEILPRNQN